jgi:hypothetical protein
MPVPPPERARTNVPSSFLKVRAFGHVYELKPQGLALLLTPLVLAAKFEAQVIKAAKAAVGVGIPLTITELVEFKIAKGIAEKVTGGNFESLTDFLASPVVTITESGKYDLEHTQFVELGPLAIGPPDAPLQQTAQPKRQASGGADP